MHDLKYTSKMALQMYNTNIFAWHHLHTQYLSFVFLKVSMDPLKVAAGTVNVNLSDDLLPGQAT